MAATSLAGLSRPGLPLSCSVPTGKKSAAARVKSEAPTRGRESLDVQHSLLHTTRPPLRHGWGHQKKKKNQTRPQPCASAPSPHPGMLYLDAPQPTAPDCAAGVYTRSRRCVAERGALPPDPRPAGGPGRGLEPSRRARPLPYQPPLNNRRAPQQGPTTSRSLRQLAYRMLYAPRTRRLCW